MLRRLAALAACVTLLAVAPTGSAYVTTLPTEADVWIDGVYAGRSPLVLDALSAGHHTLGIVKSGWGTRQLDVTVVAGQVTFSSLRLERSASGSRPADGSFAFRGVDVNGVRIDGAAAPAAADGTYRAAAGTHEVIAETAHGRLTREITVWPRTRTEVVVEAEDAPPRPSVVAPVEDYLPASAVHVTGEKIVIRYGSHEVLARIGETGYRVDGRGAEYDAAPTFIGTRLYLPIALLTLLAPDRNR